MQLLNRFGKQLGILVLMGSAIVSASSVSARQLPIDSAPVSVPIHPPIDIDNPVSAKKAMTWIINTVVGYGGKTYVQARYDGQTNPYSGDTSVDQSLSYQIKKSLRQIGHLR